jgi:hypothetical protein
LTLPLSENVRRIEQRQSTRALDEREFERQTLADERKALLESTEGNLGEPLDVSAPPEDLVAEILRRLGVR